MELIGVHLIRATGFENKTIILNDNYDLSVEIKNNEDIHINIRKNNNNIIYYEHIKNKLTFRIVHGINGSGKTTLLSALNFSKDYTYLLFFARGSEFYVEGNIVVNYRFHINNKSFNPREKGLSKPYLSLIYAQDKVDFYDFQFDNKRNTRIFAFGLDEQKDKFSTIKRIDGGGYYIGRENIKASRQFESLMYYYMFKDKIQKHLNLNENDIIMELNVPALNHIHKNQSYPLFTQITSKESQFLEYTKNIFEFFNINYNIQLNMLDGFRFKIISDAVGLSFENNVINFQYQNMTNIDDVCFNALKQISKNLSDDNLISRDIFNLICDYLKDVKYEYENGWYTCYPSSEDVFIQEMLKLYKIYRVNSGSASSEFIDGLSNKTESIINIPNPFYSPILNEFFKIKFTPKSKGEEAFISLSIALSKAISDDHIYATQDYGVSYILLDEVDTHFHPELNRKLINFITEYYKDVKSKYCILMATHSEYVLSDVPLKNLILLGDDNKTHSETFGKHIGDIALDNMIVSSSIGEYVTKEVEKIINEDNTQRLEEIVELLGNGFLKKILTIQIKGKILNDKTE